MKILLNAGWHFRGANEDVLYEASVPSNNYEDLLCAGKIENPFDGASPEKYFTAAETDYTYLNSFTIDSDVLAHDSVILTFTELDTVCELFLNGEKLGNAQNYHTPHKFEVKDRLIVGENLLELRFRSPVNYVQEEYEKKKTPQNPNGMNGIVNIRKPQSHFGWDWGISIAPSGITGSVYLETLDIATVSDFRVAQRHNEDGSVTLGLTCRAQAFGDNALTAVFSVKSPEGEIITADGVYNENSTFSAEISIVNPRLWWTRELSDNAEQPLYEVVVAIFSSGKIVGGDIMKTGLREVHLCRLLDEFGESFHFVLNGVDIFAKGSNVIPPDSLICAHSEKAWIDIVDAAEFSNMNMLRIWGGGYYAPDCFYDECDRRGILVWQDFCFACQGYPLFRDEFLKNVTAEAEYQIKRLRGHASLAVWCGNNEIEQMASTCFYMTGYKEAARKYFYETLPDIVASLDDRDYIPTTPTGGDFLAGVNTDNVGDTHLWNVWHGLMPITYYRKRYTRFCSEYGIESLPSKKTIDYITGGAEVALTDPVLTARQKCAGGNGKIKYYASSRFGTPKTLDGYVYASQAVQADGIADATGHWRRNKGRCNGSLYWQLNDCWPCVSWSGVDYFGRYKAVTYSARRFNAPLSVSIEDSDGGFYIYTLNDTNKDYDAKLTFKVCNYDGEVLIEREKEVEVKAYESKSQMGAGMAAIRIKNRHLSAYGVAVLTVDDVEVARATVLLRKERFARLPVPEIRAEMENADGKAKITLTSDKFARGVWLECKSCDLPFSDNYFDLLPNESKTVTLNTADVSLEDITIISAANLETVGNPLSDALFRLLFLLRPENFFPHLYYRRVPRRISRRRLIAMRSNRRSGNSK